MSTWHQDAALRRSVTPLYHETDWTILDNPPGHMMCLTRFATEEAARLAMDLWVSNGRMHLSLLPPRAAKESPPKGDEAWAG